MTKVLAVLKISKEVWDSIPKRDRERIIKAVKKGAFDKAREIAKTVLKRKSKAKKKRKRVGSKSTRRRRKKKAEWWQ